MADFQFGGIDDLILSLQEIASIPDTVQDEMLNAQADIAVRAQKRKIRQYRIYDTGETQRSIKKGRIKVKNGQRVIYVTPVGSRKRGGTIVRNAEILFVNEFGVRGKSAKPAIRDANEGCADDAAQAAMDIYDQYLKSKKL